MMRDYEKRKNDSIANVSEDSNSKLSIFSKFIIEGWAQASFFPVLTFRFIIDINTRIHIFKNQIDYKIILFDHKVA